MYLLHMTFKEVYKEDSKIKQSPGKWLKMRKSFCWILQLREKDEKNIKNKWTEKSLVLSSLDVFRTVPSMIDLYSQLVFRYVLVWLTRLTNCMQVCEQIFCPQNCTHSHTQNYQQIHMQNRVQMCRGEVTLESIFNLVPYDLSFASTETKFKNPITKTRDNYI